MRLTRVYVDQPLLPGTDLALPEGPAVHLARVLRLGVGDACTLFNGDGHDYPARVVAVGKRQLRVLIGEARTVTCESPLRIILLQGIARGEKMDLIMQKATELGVAGIHPIISQRSEVKLDQARAEKRLAHWSAVVIAACEQSGRAVVPVVAPPVALADALGALCADDRRRLVLDPDGPLAFSRIELDSDQTLVLAIGPEGGWSDNDQQQFAQADFQGLRLGPRILRTETAGLATIAALQARFGDLSGT
ncbi:16S rRNA (uracil(1498)-N(3))-methyltransferase [Lysobacter sp. A378]